MEDMDYTDTVGDAIWTTSVPTPVRPDLHSLVEEAALRANIGDWEGCRSVVVELSQGLPDPEHAADMTVFLMGRSLLGLVVAYQSPDDPGTVIYVGKIDCLDVVALPESLRYEFIGWWADSPFGDTVVLNAAGWLDSDYVWSDKTQ